MRPDFDPWIGGIVAAGVAAMPIGTPLALRDTQARRLKSLVDDAARASPMYKRLLADLPDSFTLRDLPVVHKRDLMGDFDQWVADPAVRLADLHRFTARSDNIAAPYLGRYLVWESSGSSGEPAVFVQDAPALSVYDALETLRRPWTLRRVLDPCYLGERMAFVGSTGGHFASVVAIERARQLNPALSARLHTLSFLQPIADLARQLEAIVPTMLSTYPSMAVLLAEERLAGRLHVEPAELWTGGETLTPAMRAFVQQAFGCRVVDSYGASEFLPLASECRLGRLHLNSDWAILEPVDDDGQPVPDGVMSATSLLTNLANRVQPIIRYDLGDRVMVQSRPCECGSCLPVVEVLGRHDDILRLRCGTRTVGVSPLALCTVLEDAAGLFDFQLEQTGPGSLQLAVPQEGEAARAQLSRARRVLIGHLAQQGAADVRITCCSGQPSRRGRSGKVRRVLAAASQRAAHRHEEVQ